MPSVRRVGLGRQFVHGGRKENRKEGYYFGRLYFVDLKILVL